jgi:hypothetical protein
MPDKYKKSKIKMEKTKRETALISRLKSRKNTEDKNLRLP